MDSFPENSALSLVYHNSGRSISYAQILHSQFYDNRIAIQNFTSSTTGSEVITGISFPGRGGAFGIFVNDVIENATVNVIVDGCNFTNNNARAYGGAIYLTTNGLSGGNTFTVINSVFNRNRATIGGGAYSLGSSRTGNFSNITSFVPSHFHLDNCNFTQNSAQFGGAVGFVTTLDRKRTTDTFTISNCIFDGNVAKTLGAAVMFSPLTYPHLPEQDSPYIITDW